MALSSRLAALRAPAFRRFFTGYATSLFGSAMSSIAVTFAVLRGGGGATEAGWVMAARIVTLVAVLPAGGVLGDRFGGRRVMMTADVTRCATQAGLAVAFAEHATGLRVLLPLVLLWGAAEALFTPSLGALVPAISDDATLPDANALLGMARSAASIGGPALAGVVIAFAGPAPVLAFDAASYAVSAIALAGLPSVAVVVAAQASFAARLREGWGEFASRTWLWVMTLHISLFNLLVWAPFLVLGPVAVRDRLGGASAYGVTMGLYGLGAAVGGALLLGRRPRRPLLVSAVGGVGWALPSGALACGFPAAGVYGAALLAGAGAAVCGTLYAAQTQARVPAGARARVGAFTSFGSYVLGPLGLAAAGPLAATAGIRPVLAFGAAWQLAATAVVLTLRPIREAATPHAVGRPEDDRPERSGVPAGG